MGKQAPEMVVERYGSKNSQMPHEKLLTSGVKSFTLPELPLLGH